MKDNTTKRNEHKTTITAHLEMMLMVFLIVAVSFACGYFVASAQIAALLAR
jgi:hypothetical protein